MSKLKAIALTIVNIVSFVGIIYYFIPGFHHVFAVSDDMRLNLAFLCLIVFLIVFIAAVILTPKK